MVAYDQICEPVSGTTVKCAVSSLRRSHTSFSRVENAAVSSGKARLAESQFYDDDASKTHWQRCECFSNRCGTSCWAMILAVAHGKCTSFTVESWSEVVIWFGVSGWKYRVHGHGDR